jgi:hypothetical protein
LTQKRAQSVRPQGRAIARTAHGTLTGDLVLVEDWDSIEVNEAIARDFGLAE